MSSVDDRIVQMKFDQSQFAAGVTSTLSMLDKLKNSLNFGKEQKGLNDLSVAASRFNMGNMGATIEGINGKLLAMGTIGVTAIANITNRAVNAGVELAKALTISPISQGLQEYETNLGSIQTILANTQASGAGLKEVNAALDELNEYSDKTIYNFSEMARNIGTFTAAGVDLETATGSIKGIANLAALSGSTSQQAAGAMYQLSQAISAGRVSLQDWNSVVNAGMGGTVFQRALAQTAERMGTLEAGAVKLTGKMKNATINGQSFRESITAKPGEESWLTSEVLTKTLEQFTGDLTDAELKAQGFSEAQIKAIQAQAKTAQDAATQVKTLSQVIDVAKETMGSGWAQTWRLIFGDFNEAKSTFTGLSNTINGAINNFNDSRNKLLGDWKKLGGRDVMIDGLTQGFKALMGVLTPIRKAFRDIFPAKTGQDLYNLTVRFRDFMAALKPSEQTTENLRRIFRGLFAAFDIGLMIVKGIVGVFKDMFSAVGEGSGGVLNFAGGIGDMIVNLRDAIKNGEGLTRFFEFVGKVLSAPIKLLSNFANLIGSLFEDSPDFDGMSDGISNVAGALNPFQRLLSTLQRLWNVFGDALERVGDLIAKVAPAISGALSGLGDAIADNMSGENFDRALDAINTGLFAGITLLFKKFLDNGVGVDLGQMGLVEKIGGTFDALTEKTQAMTNQIKAKTLLTIAGAIALLTASVVALSLVDSDALARGLTAMAVGFGQLLAGMAVLTKMSGASGFLKIPAIAASLILLATSILIMSAALTVLSRLDWDEIARGLTALAGMLAILSAALIPLSAAQGPMIRSSVALGILGAALILLATALKIFATMDYAEIGKGLVGVVGSLTAIAAAMRLMPKGMVAQAAALLLLAGALNGIALALKVFATMDWEEMGKGIAGVAGALVAIAAAMHLMPKGMIAQAAALVLISGALNILALAIKQMGGMSWEEIGKGLATIGGALLILAGGLYLMQGALAGAAALGVAAAAIALLVPSIVILGNLEWETILKAFATLAGSFLILGAAALILTPVIGVLAALAGVVALLGAGIALAGAGILAFSAAITALVAVGTAGIAILSATLLAIIKLIPAMFEAFAEGLVQMVVVIGNNAPKIVAAFTKILLSLLKAIQRLAPEIAETFLALLEAFLKVIVEATPKIVNAGIDLLIGLMEGIRDRIGEMAHVAADIIIEFLEAWSKEIPRIVEAGIQAMIDFINGMADAIRNKSGEIGGAIENLTEAFVQLGKDAVTGFIKGLGDATGVSGVVGAVKGLGSSAIHGLGGIIGANSPAKEFIKLGQYAQQGFAIGLRERGDIEDALNTMRELIRGSLDQAKEDIKQAKEDIRRIGETKRTKDNSKKLDRELKEANAALKEAQDIRKRSAAANKVYRKDLADEQQKLLKLSTQWEDVTQRLEDANDKLEEATKLRDDFERSITDKFNTLPDITEETTLDTYADTIRKATEDNRRFLDTLNKLRDLGLDDASYRKFLDEGIGSQKFLDDLLAAGRTQVDEFDKITADLAASAGALGTKASRELYQAGVDAAQGLVDGLTKQQAVIAGMMDQIATQMVTTIKKQLGIKSPSKAFAEVGKFSMEGLGEGLQKHGTIVRMEAVKVGDLAVQAMRESMAKLADVAPDTLDLSPHIAPVLDLSGLERSAVRLSDILAPRDVAVKVSYDQASVLALETAASKAAQDQFIEQALVAGDTLVFNQTNTSPKALSNAEIYRQTKNQLSVVKGALPS